jgi:hypothetical protein
MAKIKETFCYRALWFPQNTGNFLRNLNDSTSQEGLCFMDLVNYVFIFKKHANK